MPFESWPSSEAETAKLSHDKPEQSIALNNLEHGATTLSGDVVWVSENDKGVVGTPLNETRLNSKISDTQNKIAEIEAKGMDNFVEKDWAQISLLQDQLIALEKLQTELEQRETVKQAEVINAEKSETAANQEAINNLDETIVNQFSELSGLLSPSLLEKYPGLRGKLAPGYDVLAIIKQGNETTPIQNDVLKAATESALAYLKAPQNRQVLTDISSDLRADGLAKYTKFKNFLIGQDRGFEQIFTDIETNASEIEVAFGGSDIEKIDGNIVHGENGLRLDRGSKPSSLSIAGSSGLELSVWPVEIARAEAVEKEIADIQTHIEANKQKIQLGVNRIDRYAAMLRDIRNFDPNQFSAQETRNQFKNQLASANPEFEDMSPDIDFIETGAEFLRFIIEFVSHEKDAAEKTVEVMKAENIKLRRNAGILASKAASQKRLAAEKLRNKKERVADSHKHYERSGTSLIMARTKHLFARISETNPVMLKTGEAVTHFDISNFDIQGSFSPSLGNGWSRDHRRQEIHLTLMNQIMGQEFVKIGANGLPTFHLNGQIVDRMKAEAFIAATLDDMSFESKAIRNLFWWSKNVEDQGSTDNLQW